MNFALKQALSTVARDGSNQCFNFSAQASLYLSGKPTLTSMKCYNLKIWASTKCARQSQNSGQTMTRPISNYGPLQCAVEDV